MTIKIIRQFAFFALFFSAIMAVSAMVRAEPPQKARTGIAVLEFAGTRDAARQFENAISVAIGKISTFELVERTRLEQILKEIRVQGSTVIDPENAKKFGKIKGVDKLCYGDVERPDVKEERSNNLHTIAVSFAATVHYASVETGTPVNYSCKGDVTRNTGTAQQAIRAAMEKAADDFVKQLTTDNGGEYFTVVDVKPALKYFILSVGKNAGIRETSEFIVYSVATLEIKGIGEKKIYTEICRARPIKNGVQEDFTQLVPGKYEKEALGFGKWKWHPQDNWLKKPKDNKPENEIKEGLVVKVAPAEH